MVFGGHWRHYHVPYKMNLLYSQIAEGWLELRELYGFKVYHHILFRYVGDN